MANPNFANQTIWTGDNLDIMRGMNSACVDLMYLDPPFNSNANYAAPIGSEAAGAAFKDTWGLTDIDIAWHGIIKETHPGLYNLLTATRDIHGKSMMSYLIYMAIRIIEMKRILKPTASIYLHCDSHASHYLKLVMDTVFGKDNFRNEVVWCYHAGGASTRYFPKKHDTLLVYGADAKQSTHNILRIPYRDLYAYQEGHDDAMGVYHPDGKMLHDWWEISVISSKANERLKYPTQKPLALLQRVIKASSNKGDLVLDPFCGCATACIAAEGEGRQWAGIDISPVAADLVKLRLKKELSLLVTGIHRTDVPVRTDLGAIPPYNSADNKKRLYGLQEGYCNGCGTHFESRNMHIDHIVPIAKGGSHHISNLQMLCGHCNSVKGNRPQEYLIKRLIEMGRIERNL